MTNRIFVGNLAFHTQEDSVRAMFERLGEVQEVKLPTDRDTGRVRGFAFVTMGTADQARAAISELDGIMLDGRALRVNEAEAKSSNGGGGGGGGGRGYGASYGRR